MAGGRRLVVSRVRNVISCLDRTGPLFVCACALACRGPAGASFLKSHGAARTKATGTDLVAAASISGQQEDVATREVECQKLISDEGGKGRKAALAS